MIIRALCLNSFGAFRDKSCEFKRGFNHLSMYNEEGKSTLVEALAVSLYGYPRRDKFLYFPYLEGRASVSMELDFNRGGPSLELVADFGDSGPAYYSIVEGKKTKIVRYGPIDYIRSQGRALGLEISEKVSKEDCFTDAESVSQHQTLKNQSAKSNVSYVQAIDFRGAGLAELIESRVSKMKKLYTNRSNSLSEYHLLNKEKADIVRSLAELHEQSEKSRQDYDSYQEKSPVLLSLNREIAEMEAELKNLELEIDRAAMVEEYRELQRRELAQTEAGIRELEAGLSSLSFDEDESALIKLRALEEGGLNLRPALAKMLKLKELEVKKADLEANLKGMGLLMTDLNVDRAREEMMNYEALLLEYRELTEAVRPVPGSFPGLILFASLLMAYIFRENIMLAVLSLILASASLLLWAFFYLTGQREDRARRSRALELKSKLSAGLSEIKKISQATELIEKLKSLNESRGVLDYLFSCYSSYQDLIRNMEELGSEIESVLRQDAFSCSLLHMEEAARLRLAGLYLEKADYLWSRREELLLLRQRLKEEGEKAKKMREGLELTAPYYRGRFQTRDLGELEALYKESIKLRALEDKLRAEALVLNLDLDTSIREAPFDLEGLREAYRAKASDLDSKRREKEDLKEELIALGKKLDEKPVLSLAKYKGYNIRELEDKKAEVMGRQKQVARDYDRLALEVAVLKEMDIILKKRMKPGFVQKASDYLNEIAPECKLRLELSSCGDIIFVEEERGTVLPFANLSSATKAQFVFCLKLAYLDEIDPEYSYPLIVDDVFMAYDARRYERALGLLERIAEFRQVIYLEAAK